MSSASNRRVHAWRGIMGNQGKISRKQGSENVRFSSYFRSEFHFREETFTLYLLAFLSRLSYLALLIRVTEMLFFVAWAGKTWSNHWLGFNRKKKIVRPQHSLDRLKNAGKPWKEVAPHTVCVSLPNLKSERKYEEKRTFCCLVSLKSCPDYP